MKLTLEGLAYRALWELDCRSGFKALRTPRGQVPLPAAVPSWVEWNREISPSHGIRSPRPRCSTPEIFDGAVDWHLEPATKKRWPARTHWSRARSAGTGDLRLTWERNRFAHVWTWIDEVGRGVRDFEATADAFRSQLQSWRYENPYRSGINWASGQEVALRAMAWLAGAMAFGKALSKAEWHNLVELIYWHAVHIDSEFGFAARAVRNNHLIAESLALAQIGDVFGDFLEAERWRERGRAVFQQAVAEQFFDDGGYCQLSHSYHHFALELVLDGYAWFPDLRDALRPTLVAAEHYFGAVIEHGHAPNFGPNDRLDEPDFAAMLDALREVVPATAPTDCASFPDAGIHVVRTDGFMATIRAGELFDRAGHDDGLHAEVWHDGHPIAIDAGSYRYGGPDHEWFAGARSHNVCISGPATPRELLSTFTWDRIAYPCLTEFDPDRATLRAVYDAYRATRWRRSIAVSDGVCRVRDVLDPIEPDAPTTHRIHWLIDAKPQDVRIENVENFRWEISTPHAIITLSLTPVIGRLSRTQLRTEPGWCSRKYGQRTLATSITLSTECSAVRFETTFAPR